MIETLYVQLASIGFMYALFFMCHFSMSWLPFCLPFWLPVGPHRMWKAMAVGFLPAVTIVVMVANRHGDLPAFFLWWFLPSGLGVNCFIVYRILRSATPSPRAKLCGE